MDNTKLAWLAGLFDGEGCIGFYKGPRKPSANKRVRWRMDLRISSCDTTIISEVQSVLGGIIGHPASLCRLVGRKIGNNRQNNYYQVMVSNQRDIGIVLSCLLPYLVGKKSQAQILLQLLQRHKKKTPYSRLDEEVITILKKMKVEHYEPIGNTEPSREPFGSQACVETAQATLPLEMG